VKKRKKKEKENYSPRISAQEKTAKRKNVPETLQ